MTNPQHRTNWKNLKKILIDRDLTQRALARELGISDQWMNDIIRGRLKNARIRAFVSRKLGVPVERLWPSEYQDSRAA